ncbi:MAG: hypothetical protein IME99_05295 [Proteobacteria bacterium]|nr:hypothetical protein [Pseudomonadota bacterium]
MNNFLKIALFGGLLILFFTLFSVYYVPDIGTDGSGKRAARVVLPIEEVGPVAYGEEVYYGRGGCAHCHDSAGGRAPLLDSVVALAPSRYGSAGYTGNATNVIGYLSESMTEPSVYVVDGYGTLLGKRIVSPMPDVSSGPISLDAVEIAAVIAYLQDMAGLEVTVEIPQAELSPDELLPVDIPKPASVTPKPIETEQSERKGP